MTDMDITVLGGGISGITTAVSLQLLGYDVTVRTKHRGDLATTDDPAFASLWGAGAIHPHAITMDGLDAVFDDSLSIFELLRFSGGYGIRQHQHLWIGPDSEPDDAMIAPRPIEDPPTRDGEAFDGIASQLYFAEMQTYLQRLYETFQAVGGEVIQHAVSSDEISGLPGDLLINCTGYYSRSLFDDPKPYKAVRGYLLRAETGLPRWEGEPSSYVYDPPGEDSLYCFPRTDAIFLGGTHQEGDPAPDGSWNGETHDGSMITIDGEDVPERIFTGNKELLAQCGVGLETEDCAVNIGWRPLRAPDGDGVRLEVTEDHGRDVIHNYGHGGAGITVSWGSAIRVAGLVGEYEAPDPIDPVWPATMSVMDHVTGELEDRVHR